LDKNIIKKISVSYNLWNFLLSLRHLAPQ
jgi:hypothetical protein